METVVKRKLYEGMFLVDSAQAADWDATKAVLEGVLKRANAEILEMKKWDDRRLAYEINKKARGAYILCYFNADCDKIHDVEKAVQLSEQIMRVLILNTEQMSEDDMKRDTPAMKAEKEVAAAEEARAARTAKAAEGAESAEQEGSEAAVEGDESGKLEKPEEFEESGEAEGSDAGEANMKKEFGNGKL
jgi:ribosomal protein S6